MLRVLITYFLPGLNALQTGFFLEAVLTQQCNILRGRIWSSRVFFALALIFAEQAFAVLPLATIQDVVLNADGTRFNGTVTVEWKTFQAADGSIIAAQSVNVPVINGNLKVRLTPTANASAGARYTVRYATGGRILFSEFWSIPNTTALLHLRDVRTNSNGQLLGSATTVEISDVNGLQDELDSRPVRGFGFSPNRVVVAGATGALEAASGSLTDCVHVDGTTGPCGGGSTSGGGGNGPGFVDFEIPSGAMDAINSRFALAHAPSPASSLQLIRNGIVLKQGGDFSLSSNLIVFNSPNIPLSDDTILASYRVASGVVSDPGVVSPATPQVICSSAGATSSSSQLTGLGVCTIEAAVLKAGDAIEVKYELVHAGTNSATTVNLKWGGSLIGTVTIAANESVTVGEARIAFGNSATVWGSKTWGSHSALTQAAGLLTASLGQLETVTVEAQVAGQGTDSILLHNLSVVRIPSTPLR